MSNKKLLIAAGILLVVGSSIWTFHQKPTKQLNFLEEKLLSKKTMQVCNTLAATTVDRPAQFLLTADVPAGAQDLGATFQVRLPFPGESWKGCSLGTACNGALLPSMQPIGYPDGGLRYSGYAMMAQSQTGSNTVSGTTTYVRLVTQYNMPSPGLCTSQASVVLPAFQQYLLGIYIPSGNTIKSIATYREPIDASGRFNVRWSECDVWNLSSFAPGQVVLGRRCGDAEQGVQFGYSTVVDADQAQGLAIGCVGVGTTKPWPALESSNLQGCRIQVFY
jgi:hypothetical protein